MRHRYTIGVAALTLAIAIGVVSSGDAQGPVVLRSSSGVEVGTSANPLRTNPTGSTTQPVSGTVTAAQGTAANLNATVVGTGTFAVQAAQSGTWNINNISGTITLPTGAATAAKQPALGTAGAASADVLTIQGIASMTKLLVTPDSVALPANQSVNISQINGVTPLMGAGNTGTGSHRVTEATDSQLSAGVGATGDAAASVGGTGSLTAKLRLMTTQLDAVQTAVQALALGTTATTTNAALGCYLQSAASTNSTNCKASPGNFYGVRAVNTTASLYYLRLYNSSSAPTCSSSTGFIESIPIPASATGAGIMAVLPIPIGYSTGISFCFTGGGSSTDNTSAATGVYLTLYYK
jgi:hypothetical protein